MHDALPLPLQTKERIPEERDLTARWNMKSKGRIIPLGAMYSTLFNFLIRTPDEITLRANPLAKAAGFKQSAVAVGSTFFAKFVRLLCSKILYFHPHNAHPFPHPAEYLTSPKTLSAAMHIRLERTRCSR